MATGTQLYQLVASYIQTNDIIDIISTTASKYRLALIN